MAQKQHYLFYLDQKLEIDEGKEYTIGRSEDCDIFLPDTFVSRKHALIKRRGEKVIIEDTASTNGIQINYVKEEEKELIDNDKIVIGSTVFVYRVLEVHISDTADYKDMLSDTLLLEYKLAKIIEDIKDDSLKNKVFDFKKFIEKTKEKMNNLANIDRLTRLYNRRYFDEHLLREVERAKRYKKQLSLVMIDIDHFKKCNDTFGHQKGDEVLQKIAYLLLTNTRRIDMVCRYGGEEMAIILPEISKNNAFHLAEKIRQIIETGSEKETGIQVTVSLGVAGLDRLDTLQEFIKHADSALYKAKESGRNKTVLYKDDGKS